MGYGWMFGMLLLLPSNAEADGFAIQHNGSGVAAVKRADYTHALLGTPLIDDEQVQRLAGEVEKRVYEKPINATIDDSGRIVPERTGWRLDRQAFVTRFYERYYAQDGAPLEAPRLAVHANVDSELLAFIRVRQIGYYVTYFNSNNSNRFHNIKLAAKAINNYVVMPGETFSFNRVVGVRTVGKGYKRAPVIVRGEFSEGIGGGICQISSTLFNAADRAGLEIVERYSHSRRVPYVPEGRDATVNWGGPDFRFANRYNQPILIRAAALPGQLVVTLFSSDVINYKPRHVPSASKLLPEEIDLDVDVQAQREHRQSLQRRP
nr:VanW family protein [Paenibacillus athensensis]